jgi:hypothetical protein
MLFYSIVAAGTIFASLIYCCMNRAKIEKNSTFFIVLYVFQFIWQLGYLACASAAHSDASIGYEFLIFLYLSYITLVIMARDPVFSELADQELAIHQQVVYAQQAHGQYHY